MIYLSLLDCIDGVFILWYSMIYKILYIEVHVWKRQVMYLRKWDTGSVLLTSIVHESIGSELQDCDRSCNYSTQVLCEM